MPGSADIAWVSGKPITPYKQFKTANTSTDNTTLTVTFDAAPINGNLLILCVNSGSLVNTPSGWSKDVNQTADLETCIISKVSNGTEQSQAVTVNATGTIQIVYLEFAGKTTFDQSHSGPGSFAPNTTMNFNATGTTTAANEIAIAAGGLNLANGSGDARPTVSWTNGFTEVVFMGTANGGSPPPYNIMMAVSILVLTSTQTVSTAWTFTASGATLGTYNSMIATYK